MTFDEAMTVLFTCISLGTVFGVFVRFFRIER